MIKNDKNLLLGEWGIIYEKRSWMSRKKQDMGCFLKPSMGEPDRKLL
jgi:hypothetical protein